MRQIDLFAPSLRRIDNRIHLTFPIIINVPFYLQYFGENFEQNCGNNCDNCSSSDFREVNYSSVAQDLLSLGKIGSSLSLLIVGSDLTFIPFFVLLTISVVALPNKRPEYLIKVYRGSKEKDLKQNQHHTLSLYGKGISSQSISSDTEYLTYRVSFIISLLFQGKI